MKRAVLIFGPPGSGKSTQANLVARKLGLVHLDTGRHLEELIYAKTARGAAMIRRRKEFEAGRLLDHAWVANMLKKKITQIAGAGFGIVLSGSPRTEYEAERIMPLIKKLYGARNVRAVLLRASETTSVVRNSARLICPFCETPNLIGVDPCPVCGHPMKKRPIDTPDIIRKRLGEYHALTEPIFEYLEINGFRTVSINGEQKPFAIAEEITKNVL